MAVLFEKTKLLTDKQFHYCPGCNHGIIHRLVAEVIDEMNLDGKVIGVEEVNALAELPSKEVLLSMLLSAMQGPVRGLAVSLDATISGLARALQAVADQKAG